MNPDNNKILLNLSSVGNPTLPKTWSGTPHNIYQELIKLNSLGATINLQENKNIIKVSKFLSALYYFNNTDPFRGKVGRYISSKLAIKAAKKSGNSHTLHFGTLGFPIGNFPQNQNHYLYTDSTWNLWATSKGELISHYSERLKNDIEEADRQSYICSKHIFTISEYVKQNIVDHYKIPASKITVVGSGVGVIKPYYGPKDYSNGKILFVAKGRFEDKGGPLVINAFKKALKTNPNLQLSIAGQKTYANLVEDHPNIQTYGFLPLEELQDLFEKNSLFLMPAKNEPWGLVYLEAMSCKMPIVGINKNSFPELSNHGKYGFGLDVADEDKLAETLTYAFDNPQLLTKMGEEAQKHVVANFTWETVVQKIFKVIAEEK